jgi:16S rRNA (cytidine1402-2'-O)-methyltransferase
MSKLYLVPTPIGNLGDITFRGLEILKQVDLILAEDTRKTGILLKKYDIRTKLQSHHQFNEHKTIEGIVKRLAAGEEIAMVSDAGTPSISDPGFLLVRECIGNGIAVECLPGATALLPALVVSGLPSDRFIFEGFLPHKKGRKTRLEWLAAQPYTIILYESPHRLLKTIDQLIEYLGAHRNASVSRELTKIHETTVRGTLGEIREALKNDTVKGEYVIVVAGNKF